MGVAMLCVLAAHCNLSSVLSDRLYAILAVLMYGFFTQGFLLLSGLGLYVSYSKNLGLKEFYKRRLCRVLVPYLILATPYFLFTDIITGCDVLTFLSHETTLAFFWKGNFSGMWYISASMLLYAIYPFIHRLLFGHKNVEIRVLSLVITIIAGTLILKYYNPPYYESIRICLDRMSIFFVGAYLMYASCKRHPVGLVMGGVFLVLALVSWLLSSKSDVLLLFSMILLPIVWTIIFGYIFNYCETKQILSKVNRMFFWLGTYSLELYIIHLLIYHLLKYYIMMDSSEQICMIIGEAVAFILCKPLHIGIGIVTSKLLK